MIFLLVPVCRWLIFSLFYSYIVIVPLCYTRIYKLRKAMKKMGNDFEKRQKRNVVTFRYNMFIWAAELASVSWSLSPADIRLLVSMGLCKVSHCPEMALY